MFKFNQLFKNRESKAEKMNKVLENIQVLIGEAKQGNKEMREANQSIKQILSEMIKITNQIQQTNQEMIETYKELDSNIVELRKRG